MTRGVYRVKDWAYVSYGETEPVPLPRRDYMRLGYEPPFADLPTRQQIAGGGVVRALFGLAILAGTAIAVFRVWHTRVRSKLPAVRARRAQAKRDDMIDV